jgi:hypothetical protein
MNPHKTRFFKHYKNKPYKYIGVVRHSETLEEMALYESLYENKLGRMWVRPKEMFFENVLIEGQEKARFQPIQFQFQEINQISTDHLKQLSDLSELSFGKALNESFFKSKVLSHTKFFGLLVYDQNQLVGFKLGYQVDEARFYSWHGAVRPEYRELGLASELMRMQHEWCKAQNYKVIESRTRNQFKQMIRLDLASGFEIVGTVLDQKGVKIILEKHLS